jgi:hypothetical protein
MGIGTLILCAILGVGAGPSDAAWLKNRDLTIPIRFNEERRGQINELQLWYSADEGQSWQPGPKATPRQEAFSFTAPADGVYWFNVQVTNALGQKEPADLRSVPAGLKVAIDTRPPSVRIDSCDRTGSGVAVAWRTDDATARPETIRVEYRAADAGEDAWVAVPVPNPALAGQAMIVSAPSAALKVRVSVSDPAGNIGIDVHDLAGQPSAAPVPSPSGIASATPASRSGPPNLLVDANVQQTSRTEPSAPPGGSFVAPDKPAVVAPAPAERPNLMNAEAPTAPPGSGSALPPPQIISFTQINLDYEVIKQGPSGLKAVELWLTRDDGRTWEKYADDPDHNSPLTARLPGDGVYGLKLVSYSGAGFSQGPPTPGEVPEMRVEVDMLKPVVQLTAVEPDPNRSDVLTIKWTASDRNLVANPITLEWSERAEGPWQSVSPGSPELPNTGSHVWQLPLQMPYRVYLRITARDRAGNVGEYRTGSSVLVDTKKPQVTISRITPAQQYPAAPVPPPPPSR